MMAQRNGNHSDEKAKPVEGAAVYVYTMTGETATITDVHDNPITHPVISDQAGNYAYRAADGYYQEQTWFGERRVKIETGIFIGDPNLSFQVASAEVVAASAQISVDAASVSTDKGLASQYRDAAQGYAGDAQTALGLVLAAKTDVDSSVNAALAASHRYSNDATGLAGTTPGTGPASFYFIKDGSDNLVEKQNVAGVATPTSFVLPGKAYMDATLAAALAAASAETASRLPSVVKRFFPCDEGSGTTLREVLTGGNANCSPLGGGTITWTKDGNLLLQGAYFKLPSFGARCIIPVWRVPEGATGFMMCHANNQALGVGFGNSAANLPDVIS